VALLTLGACSDEHDRISPRAGCGGTGVTVERYPTGVNPTSLAVEIGNGVPGVACRLNKITGEILCTPAKQSCGLPSDQEAEPMRMQIAAFLAERDDAAAEDAYVVSLACACYSD
jgi:hypothetical protein